MYQQMFATYFKVAESAIQFQQELLRQWSGQWFTAPVADGLTEQVRALQKKAREDSSEMLNLQRKLLAMTTKLENTLIEDGPRMAVNAQTAVPGGATSAPNGLPAITETAARACRTDEDATILLREEVLHQAYLKWLEEGCPEGQDRRHYFEALQQAR